MSAAELRGRQHSSFLSVCNFCGRFTPSTISNCLINFQSPFILLFLFLKEERDSRVQQPDRKICENCCKIEFILFLKKLISFD